MKGVMLTLLLSLFSLAALHARWTEPSSSYYSVVDHTSSKEVEEGYFLFKGRVINKFTYAPKHACFVSASQTNLKIDTDANGAFEMLLPVSDSVMYCFHLGYHEIVLNYKAKSQHVLNVNFFMEPVNMPEFVPGVDIDDFQGSDAVAYKPVIYAYNSPAPFELSVKPHGRFTFVYPNFTYREKWSLTASESGALSDFETGKNYPYLFWEGHIEGLGFITQNNEMEGYVIATDTCVTFLENTLSAYGLNSTEQTDFITFWAPRMMEKKYALVQFFTTQQYGDNVAELLVKPAPTSLLRLYLCFKPLDSTDVDFVLKTPVIDPFNRAGFTVVEWGGSIIEDERARN